MAAAQKPAIVLTRGTYDALNLLADKHAERSPQLCDALYEELDRARIVPDGKLERGVVRIGSTIRYAAEDGAERTVTLVYPGEADIAQGRLSVLTPVGVALIGMKEGRSIDWLAVNGQRHSLTVLKVLGEEEAVGAGA